MKEQLLWTSYNLDYEQWRSSLEAEFPHSDEDELIDIMYQRNQDWRRYWLEPELNVPLERQIIMFVESRYKDGRRTKSYDILTNRLNSIFVPCGKYADFYVDENCDARLLAKYPDHTEQAVFRVLRKKTSTKVLRNTLMKWTRGYIIYEDFSDPIGMTIAKYLNCKEA